MVNSKYSTCDCNSSAASTGTIIKDSDLLNLLLIILRLKRVHKMLLKVTVCNNVCSWSIYNSKNVW